MRGIIIHCMFSFRVGEQSKACGNRDRWCARHRSRSRQNVDGMRNARRNRYGIIRNFSNYLNGRSAEKRKMMCVVLFMTLHDGRPLTI